MKAVITLSQFNTDMAPLSLDVPFTQEQVKELFERFDFNGNKL
jgi:hypothetical protein